MINRTVRQAFGQLRDNLKLDEVEYARAIALHHEVTAYLKNLGLIVGAFLQGSLRRKTMIAPLRDIDKVVLLATDWRNVPDGQQRVAEKIAEALRSRYPNARVEIGKHCVTLDFGDDTFSFDIVPAVDLGDDVEIIDTKNRRWQRSNTRELIRTIQERNQDCDGNFVHQVRIAKLFIRDTLEGSVPGLHVEAFAHKVITESMDDDVAVAAILRAAANALHPNVRYYDPTGDDELGHRLDPARREEARIAFEKAADKADEAVRLCRNGEDNAAIGLWHEILGDDFPKPSASTALANLGRGAGVTTSGIVSTTARVRPTPTRSWRP